MTGDRISDRDERRGWKDGHGWLFRWLLNLVDRRAEKYLGFSILLTQPELRFCLLCAARTDLLPIEVADKYLSVRRHHCHFCV